jgi:hypothetical protein
MRVGARGGNPSAKATSFWSASWGAAESLYEGAWFLATDDGLVLAPCESACQGAPGSCDKLEGT